MRNNRTTITRKQKWEEKQPCGRFKRLKSDTSHEKTWTWLRKRNLKRETESLRIAAQNNAIRTNHIKARIDKTQQNSNCRLCGDRDETINHIISECSKLAQKEYKTRHDWVGRWSTGNCTISLNLIQRTNGIWTTQQLPWRMWLTNSYGILAYKQITLSRPDLIITNKKRELIDFVVLADHRVKLKESKKKDKYQDLAWEIFKTVEHESDDYTNCNWYFCYIIADGFFYIIIFRFIYLTFRFS